MIYNKKIIIWQKDVLLFHTQFNLPIGDIPTPLSSQRNKLRVALIFEELGELLQAIGRNDLPEIADGVGDKIYVLLVLSIEYGIDIIPIWNEIQRTNMKKEGGGIREDGKILKPIGWKPPNIKELLRAQRGQV